MSKAIDLVMAERKRQIEEKGWTPEHDLKNHATGELSIAAAAYAVNKLPTRQIQIPFPWGAQWDKREKHDRLQSLIIGTALMVAELERELTIREEAQKREAESEGAQAAQEEVAQ